MVTPGKTTTFDLVTNRGHFSLMQFTLNIERRVAIYQYYLQFPYAIAVAFGVCMFLTPTGSWYRSVFAILSMIIQMFLLIMIAKQVGIFTIPTPKCGKCAAASLA